MTTSVGERSTLLQLMGFPSKVGDSNYDVYEIEPDWETVDQYLQKNPDNKAQQDASIAEDGEYPLDDALWMQSYEAGPVPTSVVVRLLRLYPQALTALSFKTASENPTISSNIQRLLAGADVNSIFTMQRSELVRLMGYPPLTTDNDYDHEDVNPDWDAVRKRLVTHPEEAAMKENETYPLADALWIQTDPVPMDIVVALMRAYPQSLTDEAFSYASKNHVLIGSNVLRTMFEYDRLQQNTRNTDEKEQDRDSLVTTRTDHDGESFVRVPVHSDELEIIVPAHAVLPASAVIVPANVVLPASASTPSPQMQSSLQLW